MRPDNPPSICLNPVSFSPALWQARGLWSVYALCMGLPSASSTAWEVKFSDGIRLMKCFCLVFSYSITARSAQASSPDSPQATNLLNDVVHDRVGLLQVGTEQLPACQSFLFPNLKPREHTRCWVSLLREDTALCELCRKLGIDVQCGSWPASAARGAARRTRARTAAPRNAGSVVGIAGCRELVSWGGSFVDAGLELSCELLHSQNTPIA